MTFIELLKEKLQEELSNVEKALDAAKKTGYHNYLDLFLGKKLEVENIIDMVGKLEKESGNEEVNPWIPVSSENFPDIGQMVLASINPALDSINDNQPPMILMVYNNTTKNWFEDGTVLAWTPTPERYQPDAMHIYYKESE